MLGNPHEKPKYSFFVWGSMMFTAGLAADILFYSFSEWLLYAVPPHIKELGSIQDWASVYPLFHWSLIPWGFYLILAVSFGFMLHVRKRKRQKYSEACRPILGKHTNGLLGRLIDLLAVFALLAGTATIFSLATPLMAGIINVVFHIQLSRNAVTIVILVVTCMIYTYSLGKQISGAANFIASYNKSGDLYGVIISMINTMPCAALVLILLTIALVFSDSSMSNLQSVSIIAAFPIGVVILLITVSFLKDARNYLDNDNKYFTIRS
ncbi:BCCT family transporter [Inconstantimicrobium porci]|uniref:BCCT family transporter n=1 Tax=Inconstantimicrobium porci TaxID=2652291 RepID=UPI003899C727